MSKHPSEHHRTAPGRLVLGALIVTVALLAAACGSSSKGGQATADTTGSGGGESTPVDGGSLVVGIGSETAGWNPAENQWTDTGNLVGSAVLEPMAEVGPDKGAKPWLAESWIANEDFTSWLVKLRPNVTFQNGEAWDATAAKLNIDTYQNSALAKIGLDPLLKDTEVVDPLTVKVNLKQPWGAFPSTFLAGAFYMMAPAMLASADHGQTHPIGTGPFTFDSWESGSTFKASKNPTYWQKGLPHLDSLEFRVITDDTSRAAALSSGDVNMILTTNAQQASDLAGTESVTKDWSTENGGIIVNSSPTLIGGAPNPLANLHARKALAYATDRQAIADLVGPGVETPTSPWAPTNPWGMPEDQNGYVDYSLDQAKAELDAYKQETGATTLKFTVLGVPDVDSIRVLQLLQSQWRDAGIEMNIETLEQTAYISKVVVSDFEAAFSRNYGFADPDTDYAFWSSDTAQGVGSLSINFTQYSTPEMDADLLTGRQSGYVDVRKQAYNDLTRKLNAGFVNIWLYRTPYSFIADPQVKGLTKAAEVGFAGYQPKTWLGDLWRTQS